MYIMLNPSTADASVDDATIRRCISFAARHGFGGIYVCNLFAYRSTDPAQLTRVADPVGPENNNHILSTLPKCDKVVAAWGVNGSLFARDWDVIQLVGNKKPLHCLGKTKGGFPKHPLYLSSLTTIIPF